MGDKKMKKWEKNIRRFKDSNNMVAEIIGTVLLLGIAVAIFSTLYVVVFAYPFPTSPPNVTLIGTIEGSNIIIEHHSGEALSLDTEIPISIAGEKVLIGDRTPTARDLLDNASKEDGVWNIGERIVYPFEYNISRTQVEIMTVDTVSNSLILMGTLDIHPECDMGLEHTVDEQFPEVGDTVTFTITTSNYRGDINATGVKINNTLDGLTCEGFSTTHGNYNYSTGIWDIGELAVGQSVSLTITANVTQIDTTKSQMAILLDGSDSISSTDWNITLKGLALAIRNPYCFPHDGSVELTVIQFGGWENNASWAELELGPVVVTGKNYEGIADNIGDIVQLKGGTALSCALYLAADVLSEDSNGYLADTKWVGMISKNFYFSRKIVNVVTDGNPNIVCDEGEYIGTVNTPDKYIQYIQGKASAEIARNYLITTLGMNQTKGDEFDAEAIGSKIDSGWLKDNIVWPEPGTYAPPFDSPGWVYLISNYKEFADTIDELFENYLIGGATSTAEIVSSTPMDPNPANNKTCITITPKSTQ